VQYVVDEAAKTYTTRPKHPARRVAEG